MDFQLLLKEILLLNQHYCICEVRLREVFFLFLLWLSFLLNLFIDINKTVSVSHKDEFHKNLHFVVVVVVVTSNCTITTRIIMMNSLHHIPPPPSKNCKIQLNNLDSVNLSRRTNRQQYKVNIACHK